jgi:hypothetical protein
VGKEIMLTFDVATAPESWEQAGDGVTFTIYVESAHGRQQVFSKYIDPKHNLADRRWNSNTVDLSTYAGQIITIIFKTDSGPVDDARFDWAGWGAPRLIKP